VTTLSILSPEWDAPSNIVAFSTTRQGGVSKPPFDSLNLATHVGDDLELVTKNRALIEERFKQQNQWQWLDQVHGTDVVLVDQAGPERTADAVVTAYPNLVCCVQTADCLPLLVASLNGDEVAAIHAGWKGLASGVIEKTIAQMVSNPSDLVVWLGPAIGPCHFEVGQEVKDCYLEAATTPSQVLVTENCFTVSENPEKYMADLYALARLRLRALGVEKVSGGGHCTHCAADQFFSYRRDGVTGRMLSAIYIAA
jgi:purine-nucleoside/S-methyl-5'-thioadenosine phosphorylase / adenosine deaminase